jgi:hypothetical protein
MAPELIFILNVLAACEAHAEHQYSLDTYKEKVVYMKREQMCSTLHEDLTRALDNILNIEE